MPPWSDPCISSSYYTDRMFLVHRRPQPSPSYCIITPLPEIEISVYLVDFLARRDLARAAARAWAEAYTRRDASKIG